MGTTASKTGDVPQPSAQETYVSHVLARTIHYTDEEMRKVVGVFRKYAAKSGDRDLLSKSEFESALKDTGLHTNNHALVQYMFKVFVQDSNPNSQSVLEEEEGKDEQQLNLREFATGLAVLVKGTVEQKLDFAFQTFDRDDNGYLSPRELAKVFTILEVVATGAQRPKGGTNERLQDLVQAVLKDSDLDKDGKINYKEFHKAAILHPELVAWIGLAPSLKGIKGTGEEKKKEEGKDKGTASATKYIVMFKEGTDSEAMNKTKEAVKQAGGTIENEYETVLKGFAGLLPPSQVELLRADPTVKTVEKDSEVSVM
eukprot:gb/GEZN01011986.1/.p1 GENE.gb/GEZN01011986.1/~~gb/GEZN01011986.1/.p1  ORF type:complete len:313 (-),score=57.38 gb/GEZN01011986.1/:156-1094(-)